MKKIMRTVKRVLMFVIGALGIALLGYHGAENWEAFKSPLITNIPFTLALSVWTLMGMIVIKDYTQKHLSRWKDENIKKLMVVAIAIVAFCIGSTIANGMEILTKELTMKEVLPMLCIPLVGTVACSCLCKKKTTT